MDTINKAVVLLSNPIVWVMLGVCFIILIAYYTFAAWAGSMEMPTPQSSPEYRQKFKFYNILAANLKRAAQTAHIPVAETQVMSADDVKRLTEDKG